MRWRIVAVISASVLSTSLSAQRVELVKGDQSAALRRAERIGTADATDRSVEHSAATYMRKGDSFSVLGHGQQRDAMTPSFEVRTRSEKGDMFARNGGHANSNPSDSAFLKSDVFAESLDAGAGRTISESHAKGNATPNSATLTVAMTAASKGDLTRVGANRQGSIEDSAGSFAKGDVDLSLRRLSKAEPGFSSATKGDRISSVAEPPPASGHGAERVKGDNLTSGIEAVRSEFRAPVLPRQGGDAAVLEERARVPPRRN